MADEVHSFDEEKIRNAMDAARAFHEENVAPGVQNLDASTGLPDTGEMSLAADCIEVKVGNHKICLKLPLGIGTVCLPIPINVPNGTAAKACLKICTTFGIPTGIKVTVTVAGVEILSKTFGKC
ncbi:hypothetical protein [Marinovum sp.]|uniref:hypothetical protein n=1 Tax=Marinovum sp. TaxID=2024839 RepID=UPI003A91CC9E